MQKLTLSLAAASFLIASTTSVSAADRDYIAVVGSSTVYPFTTAVAEHFGKSAKFKTPKIESTGTGGGFKLFCAGLGSEYPDLTNASRAIKQSEIALCHQNSVQEIIEIKIGYDGIVLAHSKEENPVHFTRKELFLALAKEVPNRDGSNSFEANPYKNWKEINPSLPDTAIAVLGPPPSSGTRDAFVELVMDEGCAAFPSIKALKKTDENRTKALCQTLREDGAYIEAGENDNLIVQKLKANSKSFGIFGFSFLEQNADSIQGALIEEAYPSFEHIASGKYSIARPLFVYAKKAHIGIIPGITAYLTEYTSERAWGEEGYLAEKGLIPMPSEERKKVAAAVSAMKTL